MQILTYPKYAQKLRTPGLKIKDLQDSLFMENLRQMSEVLRADGDGIGLAATQVGWEAQVFILCVDENLESSKHTVYINPEVISTAGKSIKDIEGCLSFPGLSLKVARPDTITWSYTDLEGVLHTATHSGYYARALQHEIDHLNGHLFVEKISSVQQLRYQKWLKMRIE